MIRANVDALRCRIETACKRAGRTPDEVRLVAVAKTFPAEDIREAHRAGIQDIGENYVQELLAKREPLAAEEIRWHFLGHLQKNKVRQIAPWISLIHAVDSRGVAEEIDRRAAQAGRVIDVLVEVNTTGEETKFGVSPDATVSFCRSLDGLAHLRVAGLMTIGPFLPDAEGSRPMFRTLRQLRDEARSLGQANLTMQHLSMGMSGDFEVALEEGATLIRIGTAIFGPRMKHT
jgi:pyridoxal phosphate enzyme (YggS family)